MPAFGAFGCCKIEPHADFLDSIHIEVNFNAKSSVVASLLQVISVYVALYAGRSEPGSDRSLRLWERRVEAILWTTLPVARNSVRKLTVEIGDFGLIESPAALPIWHETRTRAMVPKICAGCSHEKEVKNWDQLMTPTSRWSIYNRAKKLQARQFQYESLAFHKLHVREEESEFWTAYS